MSHQSNCFEEKHTLKTYYTQDEKQLNFKWETFNVTERDVVYRGQHIIVDNKKKSKVQTKKNI